MKENISETEYIKRRTEEITKDKGAAEAEKWESHWEETKTVNMPEKFVQAINKKGKKGVTFSQDSGSKYTAIINVDWVYPGWFAAAMKQPSKMNATITFVESANPDKVVLKLNCVNAIGDMYPMGIPNNNNRIAQALDMVGVGLGKFMKKKFK